MNRVVLNESATTRQWRVLSTNKKLCNFRLPGGPCVFPAVDL